MFTYSPIMLGGVTIPSDYEHYYTFYNLSGSSVIDEAATTNMTEFNTLSNILGPDGVNNGRLSNGTNDYITTNMGVNDWVGKSISIWVYNTDWHSSTVRFLYSDGNEGKECHFGGSANQVRILNDTTSYFDYSTTTAGLTNSNWHHFVFYLPSGTPKLYVDGVQQTPSTTTGITRSKAGTTYLCRRNDAGSGAFYGAFGLAHMRIYNRELTGDEITALANEF